MAGGDDTGRKAENGLVLSEEQQRRLKARNLAVALTLGALVVLFWLITVFKMGGDVANRTL